MKHLGDITKINGYEVPIVDCVIGGSPCQDLSVAGKRAGLDGERSGLFMEQIRIVKEMRENDRRIRGDVAPEFVRPRYMVWENVFGAFSSNKGEDFRVVIEETARVCDKNAVIPSPDKGKWRTSGCIVGDGWSIAWKVLDAQFWGVPQRRRRIALVADFGGESAPEILFIRNSVSGYSQQSKSQRKEASLDFTGGIGGADKVAVTLKVRTGCEKGGGKGALVQVEKSGTIAVTQDQYLFQPVYSVENHPNDSRVTINEDGIVQSLTQRMETGGGNVPMVISLDRASFNQGKNAQFDFEISDKGINSPLVAKGPGAVCYGINGDVAGTLDASYYKGCGMRSGIERDVIAVDCRNGTESDKNGSLQSNMAHSLNGNNVVRVRRIVRRLTPLECERLQGFPDGWTDIGEWTDSKGKVHKSSDAARYKALGNSIALPPWKWVLKRICACYERDATMASLFDGIGGFPYLWEMFNGKGSCLWASEIEEFPIAVTKKRIGE